MARDDFTITSFEWRKEVADRLKAAGEDYDDDKTIIEKLSALAKFFNDNDLSVRTLISSQSAGRDFVLKSSDLNECGLNLIRIAYSKWQRKAKSPADVAILVSELAKLRRKSRVE